MGVVGESVGTNNPPHCFGGGAPGRAQFDTFTRSNLSGSGGRHSEAPCQITPEPQRGAARGQIMKPNNDGGAVCSQEGRTGGEEGGGGGVRDNKMEGEKERVGGREKDRRRGGNN